METHKINAHALLCQHCGEDASGQPIWNDKHVFCCNGCLSVYQILNQSGLCEYYDVSKNPGITPKSSALATIDSNDELELMVNEFTIAQTDNTRVFLFYIPAMHCASCIWLLEKLNHLDAGIISSRANFIKKQLTCVIDTNKTNFSSLVRLLAAIGYEPSLMPEDSDLKERKTKRTALIKMGIAGFCAGNIMMFSFPQYLGLASNETSEFKTLFDLANILLSIPLIFYCAAEYFQSFFNWITKKTINVKVPLALGIGALWCRSVYEVATHSGPGYFDSLAGLIFFLLIGQYLQNRTFDGLRFGEKARKFFPLVTRVVVGNKTAARKVVDLKTGDRIILKSNEIIPADAILLHADAYLDYSFATGESTPVHKVAGEMLYAGGKNLGAAFNAEVIRPFSEGKFAEIWSATENQDVEGSSTTKLEKLISKWFVISTIILALVALTIWLPISQNKAWFVFTAVLMVACPCALALAPPFAWNTVASFFAKHGFFLKKPEVIGTIGEIENLVFDKTGTLTDENQCFATLPDSLTEDELRLLQTAVNQSNHPYSVAIANTLEAYLPFTSIADFKEFPGKGFVVSINQQNIKVGNAAWIGAETTNTAQNKVVYFSIDNRVFEPIVIHDNLRFMAKEALAELKKQGKNLVIASGDNASEKSRIEAALGADTFQHIYMECSPTKKVEILNTQKLSGKTIMIGDGINDAAGLKHADAGIVLCKDTTQFVPEASGILLNTSFHYIPTFLEIAKKSNRIVFQTFLVSLIYNIIALGLAVGGLMTPLIAAIIMPISSIALMLYAKFASLYLINKYKNIASTAQNTAAEEAPYSPKVANRPTPQLKTINSQL